uniref:Uncharacterized protein n=1 Tax=Photinus pyralis TaxID=7054 RepID=A0A1Y1MZN9_PHOPY
MRPSDVTTLYKMNADEICYKFYLEFYLVKFSISSIVFVCNLEEKHFGLTFFVLFDRKLFNDAPKNVSNIIPYDSLDWIYLSSSLSSFVLILHSFMLNALSINEQFSLKSNLGNADCSTDVLG